MNKVLLCSLLLCQLAACWPSHAAEAPLQTAKWLVDNCTAANAIADGTASAKYAESEIGTTALATGYCYGYLAGFQSGFSAGKYSTPDLHACVPSGVGPAQLSRMLEARLKEKPEFEHVPPMVFVMAVLRATWPCPS